MKSVKSKLITVEDVRLVSSTERRLSWGNVAVVVFALSKRSRRILVIADAAAGYKS